MSAVEEYRRWCEYTQPLSLVERGKAKAAIAELEAKLDTALALAALREGWAKKPEDVLSEVEALTAPLLSRAEKAEAALIYDSYGDMVQTWKSRAVALESARDSERTLRKQAEAENERLRGLLAVCDACHEPVRVQLSSSVRERAHRANVAALERCWHEAEADARAARAENERLLTRYACDVICGMGRRGNGSCSNPYDAECPALPDFIAAAKEASC